MVEIADIQAYLEKTNAHTYLEHVQEILCAAVNNMQNGLSQDDAIQRAFIFVARIERFVYYFKKLFPGTHPDFMQMIIFDEIRHRFESKEAFEAGVQLGKQIRQFVNPESDKADIAIIGHLIITHEAVTPERIAEIKKQLVDHFKNLRGLTIERVKPYLWIIENHPELPLRDALNWGNMIARTTIYKRLMRLYGPQYRFSCILFESHVDKIELQIFSRVYFSDDDLREVLLPLDNIDNGYHGVCLSLSLEQYTPAEIIKQILNVFLLLAQKFLNKAQVKEVGLFFNEIVMSIATFVSEPMGLKWAYYQVPCLDSQENDTPDGRNMRSFISDKRYSELAELLKTGASPNLIQYSQPMPNLAMQLVRGYTFFLLIGPITASSQATRLSEQAYLICISQEDDGYYVNYHDKQNNVLMKHQLDHPYNEARLKEIFDKQFDKDSRVPGNTCNLNGCAEIEFLNHTTRPYLKDTLEKQRLNEAAETLKIVKLLLDYGMDPSIRCYPDSPGSESAIEHLLNQTRFMYGDPANQWLLFEMLRCGLFPDAGRSHCQVPSSMHDTPLGKIILQAKAVIAAAAKVPRCITDVANLSAHYNNDVIIQKTPEQKLLLKTLQWRELLLQKNKAFQLGILQLVNDTFFDGQLTLDDDTFETLLKQAVSQSMGESTVVDILLNPKNELVGFSISDIRMPKHPQDPILHFIHLAACRPEISAEYPKLMSLISFQRTFFLRRVFPSAEIITAYLASSGYSYLQLSELEFYPKYNCLNESELDQLHQAFFTGRTQHREKGGVFYETLFFKPVKPHDSNILKPSDIHLALYKSAREKAGYSTLVAFKATQKNMQTLASKLSGSPMQFFKVVEKTFLGPNMRLVQPSSKL